MIFVGLFSLTCVFVLTPYGSLSLSNTSAITLINILRDGRVEPESHSETTAVQWENSPEQSQRIVLLAQNEPRLPKKSLKNSTKTNKQPSLTQSTAVSFEESEEWSDDIPPNPSALSEESSNFLDDYTGTQPIIGEQR